MLVEEMVVEIANTSLEIEKETGIGIGATEKGIEVTGVEIFLHKGTGMSRMCLSLHPQAYFSNRGYDNQDGRRGSDVDYRRGESSATRTGTSTSAEKRPPATAPPTSLRPVWGFSSNKPNPTYMGDHTKEDFPAPSRDGPKSVPPPRADVPSKVGISRALERGKVIMIKDQFGFIVSYSYSEHLLRSI